MTTSSKPKTKKITVELPIEYWLQLYEMQCVGQYRNVSLNKIARRFVIERLDKERLIQERAAAKRREGRGDQIKLTDIGINVEVISDKNKPKTKE